MSEIGNSQDNVWVKFPPPDPSQHPPTNNNDSDDDFELGFDIGALINDDDEVDAQADDESEEVDELEEELGIEEQLDNAVEIYTPCDTCSRFNYVCQYAPEVKHGLRSQKCYRCYVRKRKCSNDYSRRSINHRRMLIEQAFNRGQRSALRTEVTTGFRRLRAEDTAILQSVHSLNNNVGTLTRQVESLRDEVHRLRELSQNQFILLKTIYTAHVDEFEGLKDAIITKLENVRWVDFTHVDGKTRNFATLSEMMDAVFGPVLKEDE
ncbi:uncharacterized protein UTRI_00935 [Ustilago trichophora]|uniref:Uncharacterized protein n=1 Tax=Ustilago trichophora TaxID=86804 RepID=A0A5C3DY40_9BASI|nr:uncharacterized protein UTRI_00935 [Ustilago trichophora]